LGQCLKDITFPAPRDEIVAWASGNPCPREVISRLASLTADECQSEDEVLCSMGDPTYC
jgi:Protein of unknown function (DUF2795)